MVTSAKRVLVPLVSPIDRDTGRLIEIAARRPAPFERAAVPATCALALPTHQARAAVAALQPRLSVAPALDRIEIALHGAPRFIAGTGFGLPLAVAMLMARRRCGPDRVIATGALAAEAARPIRVLPARSEDLAARLQVVAAWADRLPGPATPISLFMPATLIGGAAVSVALAAEVSALKRRQITVLPVHSFEQVADFLDIPRSVNSAGLIATLHTIAAWCVAITEWARRCFVRFWDLGRTGPGLQWRSRSSRR